jgi:integrase
MFSPFKFTKREYQPSRNNALFKRSRLVQFEVVHVTTAAKLMGHSNPMMTLKVYTQVKDDEAGLAGVAISKFITKTTRPPSFLGGPAV